MKATLLALTAILALTLINPHQTLSSLKTQQEESAEIPVDDLQGFHFYEAKRTTPPIATTKDPLPVIVIHGISCSCKSILQATEWVELVNNPYGNKVYCIENGGEVDSILRSANYLANYGCLLMERFEGKYNLRNGFLLYGSSQGGVISRAILEQCSVGKYVKGYIISSGPNMGVMRIPQSTYEKA